MSGYDTTPAEDGREAPRQLSKPQRRAIGVLVEKAFTTPEYYPLTLKAATNACNQKSNRSPVTNYSEDAVYETMEELRELGLLAVVNPESGRTERYRHYLRKRYPFTEPQLAVMAELWLRGGQSLGELRARASRMVTIESLDVLREELQGLIDQGFAQASGDIKRRGVEVDHCFYTALEGKTPYPNQPVSSPASENEKAESNDSLTPVQSISEPKPTPTSSLNESLDRMLRELQAQNAEIRSEVEELRQTVVNLRDDVDQLKQSLGV